MLGRPRRNVNRLLVLCTSINDVTVWPFWKFLQMKKLKGITDMAFLAFNSHGGSFEAAIAGTTYKLKNYVNVTGYRQDMLEDFLHRWHDPGRSYFVYGGHGMGDYLEFESDKVALQAYELAQIMGRRRFEAMVFDACFMANVDCAYHLRHNTQYIGACEGYMWEPDTELDLHVLNTHNASVMTRFRNPLHILKTIQKDYCARCPRGDFAIIDTTHIAALRDFVQRRVIQRVYDRAALYTGVQHSYLAAHATRMMQEVNTRYQLAGQACENNHNTTTTTMNSYASLGGSAVQPPLPLVPPQPHATLPLLPATRATLDKRHASSATSPSSLGLTSNAIINATTTTSNNNGCSIIQPWSSTALPARLTRRQRIERAIQFEHALYPSELRDKHIVDLKSYLIDLAIEEAAEEAQQESGGSNSSGSSKSKGETGRVAFTSKQQQQQQQQHSSRGASKASTPNKTRPQPLPEAEAEDCYITRHLPSSAMCVQAHAALPAKRRIPLSPPLPLQPTSNTQTKKDATTSNNGSAKDERGSAALSPFPRNSAHYGLDLFHKVVLQHTGPRAAQLYSARLHGLSLSVHEFSALSRPAEPWVVDRRVLKKRCREFLQCGVLSEVRMREKVKAAAASVTMPVPQPPSADVVQDTTVRTKERGTTCDAHRCTAKHEERTEACEQSQTPVVRGSVVQSS